MQEWETGRDRCARAAALVWTTAIMLPAVMLGQTFLGSIVGTITDTTGASVPAAKVTLTNTGTDDERTASTSNSGDFQFLNLVPGIYRISVEKESFSRLVRQNVEVSVQAEVRVDGTLAVGVRNQTIEITSLTPPLDTESGAVSTVVNSKTIEGLPLNGRNVLNLIALTNGVVPQAAAMGSPSGNSNGGSSTIFGNIMNYQIGGGQNNQSAVFLDGAPLNISQSNSTALVPTQDAVHQFRVVSNGASAEFGKFGGGVVNLTTKSGSNAFHGGIYEFFRNRVLNANAFFNNLSGLGRPKWNQNQYGANLGGPIRKDRLFFFFAWENFDYNIEVPSSSLVPTQRMRAGDFTEAGVPAIYDPLTVCGFYGNAGCAVVNGSPVYTRQPFPENTIPRTRISPSALFIEDGFSLPNRPGLANNYFRNQPAGGPEHQYNARTDWNLSDKHRLYARYTYWNVYQRPSAPFSPPARQGDIGSRFEWQTHQAAIGDTYVLSPAMIISLRASFLRNTNSSIPGDFPVDLSKWGNGYIPLLSQLDGPVEPQTNIQGFIPLGGFGPQTGRNNVYAVSGDLNRTLGRHTIKFGGETRDAQVNRFQLNPAGAFVYNNGFTSQNPLATGNTGYGMASFLLGLAASGSTKVSLQTANNSHYSGLYVTDTFHASRKLTLTAGLRWDLPFAYTERYDRIAVFDPGATNPLAQATGLPLKGSVVYVNSSADPYRSVYRPHYQLFGPRLGLAYRFIPSTVVRLGYAVAYAPNDTNQPDTNNVNSATTTFVGSLNGGITPYNTPADPYPTGLIPAAGRDAAKLLVTTQGQTLSVPLSKISYPYVQQWNVTIGRDLGHGVVAEAGYAGLKGTHLAIAGNANLNQLPDQYDSMGQALLTQVTNPFIGKIAIGPLANATVNAGQLLRPYPQYQTVLIPFWNVGNSTYHSLQTRFEQRFVDSGDTLMVNYTWSKLLANVGAAPVIGTFVIPAGTNGIQDWNNIGSAKALDPTSVAHRLVVSYVYDLPIGKGRALLDSVRGVVNGLVSGWGVNGVTTIQSGFPLSISYGGNNILNSTFGAGTIRPNVIAGCQKSLPGSAVDRFNSGKWFNTACFTAPFAFGFGDEPAYDPELRGQGIVNFDLAVVRNFVVRERYAIQFRAEAFNLANYTRFANPGTVMGTPTFGAITAGGSSQQNQPRLIQLAVRIKF